MWWPFSSDSSRWQDQLEQYEKIIEQYIRRDPSEELPQTLNQQVKEFEEWAKDIRARIDSEQESFAGEVKGLNALGEEINSLQAELSNKDRPTDADAMEALTAILRRRDELVQRYEPRKEEYDRRRSKLDEGITKFNTELESRHRELQHQQKMVTKQLDEYQRWRERKGPEKYFREINQLYAEIQNACRQEGEEARCAPYRDRLRALRRELGERARIESEREAGLLVVEVVLLDEEPCMMTFDPGSTVTSLSPEMVEVLGMKSDVGPDVELHLPAGITIKAPQLLIPKLSCQDYTAQYVRGVVLEESVCGVDGSLGLSYLNRFDYHIEGQDPRRLTLTPQSTLVDETEPIDLDTVDADQTFDVFISHKTEDAKHAREVFEFLKDAEYRVFYSPVTLAERGQSEFLRAIDRAIENSRNMVVIGSSRAHLEEPWVESEWGIFDGLVRCRRKQGNIVTVLCGRMSVRNLPIALSRYHAIRLDAPNWKTELVAYLPKRK
jgi:hypothetical protein